MRDFNISTLDSGGVITNYYCTSTCAHCLYSCSPTRSKEYMDIETARKVFRKITSMDCFSVHIGGGEPMLNFEKLTDVLKVALEEEVDIEYIETNSSWYTNKEDAVDKLKTLKLLGVGCLLISISPFHNEYIPLEKVQNVLDVCKKVRMSVFPWLYEMWDDIEKFDTSKTHKLEEYRAKYGQFYIGKLADRYWIELGGRALKTFDDELPKVTLEKILTSSTPCEELTRTGHFHFDLFGNYIPGLCSGLSIDSDDLGLPLDFDKYPLIGILHSKGIKELYSYADSKYGFVPLDKYLSKCHLCNHIRKFIQNKTDAHKNELQPIEYYQD